MKTTIFKTISIMLLLVLLTGCTSCQLQEQNSETDSTEAAAGNVVATETASGFTISDLDCSFEGDWTSNWGDMNFVQNGTEVTATYTHDDGKIDGTMMGNILIGTWSEAPTYEPWGDAGDVELELGTDCNSFNGNWRYGSTGEWSGGWNGTRIESE